MKRVSSVMVVLLLVLVVGCASKQHRYISESYNLSDVLLESTRKSMRGLCDNEVFTFEKCTELRLRWEAARDELVKAGDALIEANRAGTTVDTILNDIKDEIRRVE